MKYSPRPSQRFITHPSTLRGWNIAVFAFLVAVAIAMAFLGAGHAFAADILTDNAVIASACGINGFPPCTSIAVKPLVEFIQPYLTAIATVVAPIIAYWIAQKVATFLGVTLNATQVARLKSAAATEAGALVAQEADSLKTAVVHVNDPRIVAAANSIAAKLPDTMTAVGATPESVAKMVQGELGKLQAGAPPADVAAAAK